MSRAKRTYPDLASYLQSTGTSLTELSRETGISISHLCRIARRERSCSLRIARRIADWARIPLESLDVNRAA